MTDLRIADAPELTAAEVNDTLKVPTGGYGNYSITMITLRDWLLNYKMFATQSYVNGQVNTVTTALNTHTARVDNPHQVTKSQVGLGNVDNTSDVNKPVSAATQTALTNLNTSLTAAISVKANSADVYAKSEVYTKVESDGKYHQKLSIDGILAPTAVFDDVKNIDGVNGTPDLIINQPIQNLANRTEFLKTHNNLTGRSSANSHPSEAISYGNITQKKYNDGVESVSELLTIQNPYDGMRITTKSYHAGLNKGACSYYYDSSRIAENNGGSVINGWAAIDIISDVTQWGAKGDGVSDDTVAFQNAVDAVDNLYVPEGTYLCNVILNNAFNIRGSGKSTVLKPFDVSKPVLTNINRVNPSWSNDTVSDLELRSTDFTGTGFQYGVLPAVNDYYGVGRVVMNNVRVIGFAHGVRKVNGNIGNKYYNCNFEYNKYGVYATSNQVAIPNSTFIMHSGCDMYYSCNFSENTVAGVAYYDKTHGSGQWLFDHCTFQFNSGFGLFFDFDIPSTLFSPIVLHNTWFEENGGNLVAIDRYTGNTETLMSVPKKVFGSNDIIIIGGENYNTRLGLGTLNPQRTLHVHEADAAIIQLTTGYTGDVNPNRGALVYFTYPDTIIENKEGGRILLRSPYGDAEVDINGNLVSRKAKIGYGKGAGNVVTQAGNKDLAVTCNTPSGRIITSAQSLAAGANISFILNNSYIEETDVLIANVRYSPSNSANYYDVKVINVNTGMCIINIKNTHNIALAEEIHISFCIVKGSIDPVY